MRCCCCPRLAAGGGASPFDRLPDELLEAIVGCLGDASAYPGCDRMTRAHERSSTLRGVARCSRACFRAVMHTLQATHVLSAGPLPDLELVQRGVTVDAARLTAYCEVCGFGLPRLVPATYPHVLAFPLLVALMTDGRFPFVAVGTVQVAVAELSEGVVEALERGVRVGERLGDGGIGHATSLARVARRRYPVPAWRCPLRAGRRRAPQTGVSSPRSRTRSAARVR